ncbi:helix-hairpin-helix domain-containing protein [Lachnoanaerobaculum umeaense]|uniref:Competence protein ComEA n=1 Tax=Lachnoanaerobaculum umeaense TaxID=617123 RepID=A0A385PZU6_9FIRM|nr:helix-hairpin-helix domain-containing protein [Lachnoanaerobaculum umeaense]AYA99466.1 competence protein ComEA [Lachnoanaerobaculum umeaense]PZW99571.1 competence protein ComEA [Lachnoanaerobaculum umeaense]
MKKVFLITFLMILLTSCNEKKDIEFGESYIETAIENTIVSSIEQSTDIEEYINVFVSGAVNNPDVYTLKKGSIIKDAVDLAGGFSEEACRDYVNLAKKLEGGEHIMIPTMEQMSGLSVQHILEESQKSTLVNINTATKEELMSLPGIGERKADSIIEYRNSKSFSAIEDIMNISGIKEAAFNKIRDKICIN